MASSNTDPFLGHVLADRYLVKRIIGEGGMGRVYEAEQLPLEKPVAVKILHQHLLGDEHSVARFVAEAREASRLNHPHIVSVIEFGETSYNVLFLVMEYLRGRPLSEIIAEEYPLTISRIWHIFRQVLLALQAAHDLGVVHRDLKPDNVFIESLADGTERVKVIDFGIAKRFDQQSTGLTSPGMVCGTPEYMSPEQVVGDALDPRSDVYALGVLLYELLVGTPPFLARSAAEVMLMHAEDSVTAPSVAAQDQEIPESLDAIVLWALAKDREERMASADQFRRVLDSWMLVSTQGRPDALGPGAVHCPSCQRLSLEPGPRCPNCGFALPEDQPVEGMPFLAEAMGEAQVRRMRESQRIPTGFELRVGASSTGEERRLASAAAPAIQGYLPLVGREAELTRILGCLDAGGSLALVGEPGLGKSRLLDELARSASTLGWRVIRVSPRDDPHWPTPFWPVGHLTACLLEPGARSGTGCPDQVAEASGSRGGMGESGATSSTNEERGWSGWTGGLSQQVASDRPPGEWMPLTSETLAAAIKRVGLGREAQVGLGALFGLPEAPSARLEASTRRRESFAALRDLVTLRAGQQPLALLLEDVDQMDAPSGRVCQYLQSLPIRQDLVVVTTQGVLRSEAEVVPTVVLHPLGREESEGLATLKLGGGSVAADVSSLLDLAGGNPFYIDQLVRLVEEGGLPGHVRRRIELLDARLDRLPMHLRQSLQRVCVHGGQASMERLLQAFPRPADGLRSDLDALESLGLVESGSGWVRTSHTLVEEAVLAGMPAEIRREAHQRLLEATPISPRTVGSTVRHAVGCEDEHLAIEALDMGAAVAWSFHDRARAIQWLQQALHKSRLLWGRGELGISGSTRVTAELARKLAWVLKENRDLRTAEAVLLEVQTLLDHDQPFLAACVLMDQSAHVMERGMTAHAEEQLERALKLSLGQEEATWLHVELLYRLGDIAARRGNRDRALTLLSEGFGLAERLDEMGHSQAWRFQLALGELHRDEGQSEQAELFFESARIGAQRSGVLPGVLKVEAVLAELLAQAGDLQRARDHLGEAIRCALEIGDRTAAARLSLLLGDLAQRQSAPEAALACFRSGRALAQSVDLPNLAQEAEERSRRLRTLLGEGSSP